MLCKFRIYYSLLIVFLVGPSFSGISQVLNLKVSGDKESGYYMDILNGDDLLLHNKGEFSLNLSNLDLISIGVNLLLSSKTVYGFSKVIFFCLDSQ